MCDGYKALCYYMACDDENDKIQSSEDVSVPGATSPVNNSVNMKIYFYGIHVQIKIC